MNRRAAGVLTFVVLVGCSSSSSSSPTTSTTIGPPASTSVPTTSSSSTSSTTTSTTTTSTLPPTTAARTTTTTAAASTTETIATAATTTVAATTTMPETTLPPSPTPSAWPLEVSNGGFHGVGPGTPVADVLAAVPELSAPVADAPLDGRLCVGGLPNHWVSTYDSLHVVFEGTTLTDAILTNWSYDAPSAEPLLVLHGGVTVGADLTALQAQYPDVSDFGNRWSVDSQGVYVDVADGRITSILHIDCLD